MIDPTQFNQDNDVGEWVDAMARIEGTAVADLKLVFSFDWEMHPDKDHHVSHIEWPTCPPCGEASVTVVPSGPTTWVDANLRLIIEAINSARSRLLITTPYFVPNEPLVMAIQNAAARGVDVRLCLPRKNDSTFVRWASRRYLDSLMAFGVHVLFFEKGLLHTKAITVDDDFTVFGTVNMDNRSMHLNFELMLLVFDKTFVSDVIELQQHYEALSHKLDPVAWRQRGLPQRLAEGLCYLISPLL